MGITFLVDLDTNNDVAEIKLNSENQEKLILILTLLLTHWVLTDQPQKMTK